SLSKRMPLMAGTASAFPQRGDAGGKPRRRGIVPLSRNLALDDRQKPRRQFLAEFHAPLVEGVDAEKRRFHEHPVLVERDQPSERERLENAVEDRQRRPV